VRPPEGLTQRKKKLLMRDGRSRSGFGEWGECEPVLSPKLGKTRKGTENGREGGLVFPDQAF